MKKKTELSRNELDAIRILTKENEAFSGNRYEFPGCSEYDEDTDVCFAFKSEDNRIVCAIAFTEYDEYIDFSAITSPQYRNHGLVKELIKDNLTTLNKPLIYTLDSSMDRKRHSLLNSDYLLQLTSDTHIPEALTDDYSLRLKTTDEDGSYYEFFKGNSVLGHIFLTRGNTRHCISDVYITPKYRGSGYSRILMELAIRELDPSVPIILHVNSSNIYACKTYFGIGFKILERIDYYINSLTCS